MRGKTLLVRRHCATAMLAGLIPAIGLAQPSPSPANELTVQLVKTGLFVISGGGCNSVLRLSQNGLILVDGKLPGNYAALVKKAQKTSFSREPVRILIVTDHLERHTGNDAMFLAAGTRILANENVSHNLEVRDPSSAKAAPLTFTYKDSFTLKLGGVEAQLLHFGNAHTSGDTVVYFPNLKAVAVGDLYSSLPDPDYAAGGSLVKWGPVIGEILKLDFDTVIPGNGPTVTRADLQAFQTKLQLLVRRARKLVASGVPKDRLMTELKSEDPGWKLDFQGAQLDGFYAELAGLK